MWYLYVIGAIVLFCFGGLFALVILDINSSNAKSSNDEPFLRLAYMGSFDDLLEKYEFADGTPCGKEAVSCQI